MIISKEALIDISGDASNSLGFKLDGMLLCGIQFPAMTGTAVTCDFSVDGTNWYDVKETDGTDVSYTISVGDAVRVDPSGWAFASNGYLRITSDGTEAEDRSIIVHLRHS